MAESYSNKLTRLAVFIGAVLLVCQFMLAGAARSQEDMWATWTGPKFGTTIAFPRSLFTLLPEPDAHDGRTFVSRDGARVAAFAYFNDGQTIESIDASLQDGSEYGHIITRKRGAHSTVASGIRVVDGWNCTFYQKHFLEPGGKSSMSW